MFHFMSARESVCRCEHSSIIIQFKKAPFVLFRDTPVEQLTTNRIVIHIQPDEGITLHFGAKIPGPIVSMGRSTWISIIAIISANR